MKTLLPALLLPMLLGCAQDTAAPEGDPSTAQEVEAATPPGTATQARNEAPRLAEVVAANWRRDGHRARGEYRHPVETLEFCGADPAHRVATVTPGRGWYAEWLAAYVHDLRR